VYNPASGQFLTRDPLAQQTGQPYAYAGGDPVNNSDPGGQASGASGQALVAVIEPDGGHVSSAHPYGQFARDANLAAQQIRDAIVREFAARNPNRFTIAPADPRIPRGVVLPYQAPAHADLLSLDGAGGMGSRSGEIYNLDNIYESSNNYLGHKPYPDAAPYRYDELANLQSLAGR